ncbi:DUF4123 domain-containing protein [Noviherbaspirillum sp.]|uniref:DUF4123 domain-containing protein n=1 Tax=Noviherbaspirillum sp. TaxID=1926288 RepID=UPI002FE40E0E
MAPLNDLIAELPRASLFAVVDAAVLDGLLETLHAMGTSSFRCLLPGHIEPDIAHVAPYLAPLQAGSPLVAWLDTRCHLPWGYVIESGLSLAALQLHLRRFSETRGPQGEEWWFRYWDPRVLRALVSILDPTQGAAFMNGIVRIHVPGQGRPVTSASWDTQRGRIALSTDTPVPEGVIAHARV